MNAPTLETTSPARTPTMTMDVTVVQDAAVGLVDEARRLMPVINTETGALKPIANRDEYKALDLLVGRLTAARKTVATRIESFFEKHIKAAKAVHQGLCDDRRDYATLHDQPLALEQANAVALMRAFEAAEKKREEDARAEADRIAKEKAAEAAKKAEQDRKDQLKKDEDDKLARASAAEAKDDAAAAEHILAAPPPPPPPPPPPVAPVYTPSALPIKSAFSGTRKNWMWKSEGIDPRAALVKLIKAAAENPDAYADFLTFDEKSLKERAKAKEQQARVPGIEFYNDAVTVNRAGRA